LKRLDDVGKFVCRPDTSVREAISRIDATTPNLFQIVLDADGRVVGTLTDGDIRRGFARGMHLEATIAACMRVPPVTGVEGEPETNRQRIRGRRFLPVCDAGGRLVHILVEPPRGQAITRALVMAGGYGKRLGERTRATPKPLLEVGGRPILARILDRLVAFGVEDIQISVHYLAEQVEAFVEAYQCPAPVRLVRETVPLGTAGALGLIDQNGRDPVLVINGDVLSDLDLNALLEHHLRQGCAGTIAASRFEYQVPYGVLEFDENHTFNGILEKPRFQHLVSAGVYYLDPAIVRLVTPGQRIDMPDLLRVAARNGMRITVFPVHEYWTDIGRPDDFEQAEQRHSVIASGAGPSRRKPRAT
jgi:UDP-2,4-diacetamido-2,4,6-trideoxy-beta-L-gulopyranose hydrolase